jgi:hypothetical protein
MLLADWQAKLEAQQAELLAAQNELALTQQRQVSMDVAALTLCIAGIQAQQLMSWQ